MSTPIPQRPYNLKFHHEILTEGVTYIEDRAAGRIRSFKTPWAGFNNATIGGLEWGSLLTIGARPGAGKTMIVSQILREAKRCNPHQDFNVLEFQFEMGAKQYASREFMAQTALDYNIILSTTRAIDQYSINLLKDQQREAKAMHDVGIYRAQINDPLNKEEIEKAIYLYYNKFGGKPMIITIDHSWLIKKGAGDREKIDVLYNTAEMIMQLKNKLPVIFIMLTQLNRGMDESARKNPSTIANYPTSSDIFGGDALMQASDVVVALNRPYKSDIFSYGPKKYPGGPHDVYMHLLKVRNGRDDISMLFFKAEFERGRLTEIADPHAGQTQQVNPANPNNFRTLGAQPNHTVSADIGDEL